LLFKLWLSGGVIFKVLLSNFVMTELLYVRTSDVTELIPTPFIDLTLAMIPPPSVFVLSKSNTSPTLWFVPPLIICKLWTPPLSTVCISESWVVISFVSVKESVPAFSSETLYGNVFLLNSEFTKSNDWLITKLSDSTFDLNLLPIKYGNVETPTLLMVAW